MLPKISGIPGQPIVFCITRLVPEKGHETLIAALSLVAAATLKPSSDSWAMDRSTRRPAVWQIANFLLSGCAFSLDNWTSLPYYDKIFFGVDFHRGGASQGDFGGRAAGLPVVTAEGGGRSEVVKPGKTGWLVPSKNVAALANSLSHLLSNGLVRPAFGQAGRRRVERRFSCCHGSTTRGGISRAPEWALSITSPSGLRYQQKNSFLLVEGFPIQPSGRNKLLLLIERRLFS
jgi:hypothetical protein